MTHQETRDALRALCDELPYPLSADAPPEDGDDGEPDRESGDEREPEADSTEDRTALSPIPVLYYCRR